MDGVKRSKPTEVLDQRAVKKQMQTGGLRYTRREYITGCPLGIKTDIIQEKYNMRVIAVDLGASSGRLIAVELEKGKLKTEEIHRFANEGICIGERTYTDILNIYHEIIKGLQKAYVTYGSADAMGIDSWGVDFALLDKHGEMIGNPFQYRDIQANGMIGRANKMFGEKMLFSETGVQDMWYNTVFQLMGIKERNPELLERAETFLMVADALGYFLTDRISAEYTGISTTQLYNLEKKEFSDKILSNLGIKREIFPEVVNTGTVKGTLNERSKKLAGIPENQELKLIATAQHDSASAAYAVPAVERDYVFINSGTWSILGMVIDKPIITDQIFEKNYSNEGAAFGKVKLVNSVMGMWLIQELRRAWEKKGKDISYDFLIREAKASEPFGHMINVDDELFVAPSDMEEALNVYCEKTGQSRMTEQGEMYRTVMESLAFMYRKSIDDLEKIAGKKVKTLYLLGGSVQDEAFCQYISNATGKIVSAGPVEATAVGNAMIQLRALGAVKDEKESADMIRDSFHIVTYVPQNTALWNEMYERYKKIICL